MAPIAAGADPYCAQASPPSPSGSSYARSPSAGVSVPSAGVNVPSAGGHTARATVRPGACVTTGEGNLLPLAHALHFVHDLPEELRETEPSLRQRHFVMSLLATWEETEELQLQADFWRQAADSIATATKAASALKEVAMAAKERSQAQAQDRSKLSLPSVLRSVAALGVRRHCAAAPDGASEAVAAPPPASPPPALPEGPPSMRKNSLVVLDVTPSRESQPSQPPSPVRKSHPSAGLEDIP